MKRIKPKTKHRVDSNLIDYSNYTREEMENVLRPNQVRFCHIYNEAPNGTRAYMKAYRRTGGGKNFIQSMGVNAHKLLKNPKVVRYLQLINGDIARNLGISKQKYLRKLDNIASARLTDLFTDWVSRKELAQVKLKYPELEDALKKTDYKLVHKTDPMTGEPYHEEYFKVELHDPMRATEMVFKALGWNEPDKLDITVEQPLFPDLD